MLFLCNIANVTQRTFKIVQKSRSPGHGDIIISTNTLTVSPETSTCEVLREILLKLQAEFVYINDVVELGDCMSDSETSI